MDLKKTGEFIAERRKAENLTQVKLAEMLCVTEKAVSKWETGRGFPDTSLVLPLCEALDISANELLSGCLLSGEEYKFNAEKHIVELKSEQEKNNKFLLTAEIVFSSIVLVICLTALLVASYLMEEKNMRAAGVILMVVSLAAIVITCAFAIAIEANAGFYECRRCGHRHIPSYRATLIAMHYGRTRYLKCPKCGKRSWQKKKISDD